MTPDDVMTPRMTGARIDTKFHVKGRGNLLYSTLPSRCPEQGTTVTRPSDGASWVLIGIDRQLPLGGPRIGSPVGFLLRGEGETPVAVGDWLEWEEPT